MLVSIITTSNFSFGQSKGWVMAPYYTKNVNGNYQTFSLPITTSGIQPQVNQNSSLNFYPSLISENPQNYHGQVGKSMGVFDDSGNLILFMVDNNLYDSEGYFIANSAGFHYINIGNNINPIVNEQFIINVPGTCNKFYVGNSFNSELLAPAEIPINKRLFGYSILDLDNPNPFYPGQINRKGKLDAVGELLNNNFLATMISELKYSGEFYDSFFGVSTKIPNTKNFFVFVGENILLVDNIGIHKVNINQVDYVLGFNSFEIDGNCKMGNACMSGITEVHDGFSFTIGYNILKEIEFYPTPTGYKVAFPITYTFGITCPQNSQLVLPNTPEPDDICFREKTFIAISSFNFDGSINEATRLVGFPMVQDGDNRLNENEPIGIEFSGDGNKLFVTSSNNSEVDTENPLYYLDLNVSGNIQTHLNFVFEALIPINNYPNESIKQTLFNNFIEKDNEGNIVFIGLNGPKNKITNNNSITSLIAPVWDVTTITPTIIYEPKIIYLEGGNGSYFLAAQPDYGTLFESFDLTQPGCCAKWIPQYKRDLSSNSLDIFIPPLGNTAFLINGAKINGTVTFGSGTVFTINNQTINFGPKGKIILEENSSFTANSCTFKAIDECPVLWKGFEVWGNNRIDQDDYSAEIILNNSTISDAFKGIAVSKLLPDGNPILNTASGIVKATNSNFENNHIDVQFYPYHPSSPTSIPNNLSFFKKCNFYTNLPVLKNGQLMPNSHIKMNNVRNVSFEECSFYNTNTSLVSPQQYGMGILSMDAQLKIGEYSSNAFIPPNTFTNLYQGIAAYGGSTINSATIINNSFINCRIGIVAGGLFNAIITKNSFKNYLNESPILPILNGNCPQIFNFQSYTIIDDNTFANYNFASSNSNGIFSRNNSELANYTNLNRFNNFTTAQYLRGYNPVFKFSCNVNQQNTLDVYNAPNSTIANVQGDNQSIPAISAANKFSQGSTINLQNDGNSFRYVFNPNTPFETPVVAGEIILTGLASATSICEPLIETYHWSGGDNPGGFIAKLETANSYNTQLQGIFDAITFVKDGGNTDSLIAWANKQLSASQQNQYVSNLLSISPNVSAAVLIEIAASPTISVFDKIAILAANPKAGSNKTILDTLSQISNPLTQAAINYIRQGNTNFSFLQYLEDLAVEKELQRNVVLQNLFLELQLDPIGLNSLKMQQVLSVYHNPQAKVEQAYWALQHNNYAMADSIINYGNIKYSRELSSELENEIFWINKMIELQVNQKDPYNLEETDKDIIRGFALNTNSKAATQAKGFMYYFYDENLFDVSSSSSARIARTQNAPQEKNIWQSNNSAKFENDLLISPNPAKDFVNITLINSNQIVNIFDAQGKKVKTIQPEANSTRINLTDLEQGLYFVTFDKIRHKLIILR